MSSRTKKILIIVSVVLVIIFIGLLIYNWLFKPAVPAITPPGNAEIPLAVPGNADQTVQRLVALTQEAVLGVALTQNSQITYVAWDGTINQLGFDGGAPTKINSLPQESTGTIIFSPNGLDFVAKQTLPSGTERYILFDSSSNSLKSLPANIQSISFNPTGQQLLISLSENGISRLVTANIKDLKNTTLTTSKIPDLVLGWEKGFITLKTRPSGLATGILYTLDPKTKKTSRVLGGIYGLTASFSPSNKKILYSQTDADGRNLQLNVVDLAKNKEQNLNIISLPEKCAWLADDRTLYCGDISGLDDFIMPDDYYKRKLSTTSTNILKINLDTAQVDNIISGGFDAVNLMPSADGTYLFFVNKIDGRLYRLTL